MKLNFKIITVLFIVMTSCIIYPQQTKAQQNNVSFQVFYDQLSPYGQWIDYSNYGYVWIPNVESDFVPYSTDGHWILTDDGWTWDSDYDWGWAAFHYGRWSYDDSFGWFWVPDSEWGPAWVNWREADGYYGWSPMEPGMSLSMSFDRTYDNHHDHWIFINSRDIERTDINLYYVNQTDRERIARNSTVIHNTYLDNSRHTTYVSGPSRSQVQKVTGRTITPVVIQENNKPGQAISNGQLRIYRPQVVKNSVSNQKAVPSRITNLKDVKKSPIKNGQNNPQSGNSSTINRQISQPNRVAPQNNNQQNSTKIPVNQDNNRQSIQNQRPVNSDINKPVVQPQMNNPRNNNQLDQQNVNQQINNSPAVQQRTISPQNNTVQPDPQRNVDIRNNNPQPAQQPVIQQNNKQEQKAITPVNNQNKQPVQSPVMNKQNKKGVKPHKNVKPQIKVEQPKEVKP